MMSTAYTPIRDEAAKILSSASRLVPHRIRRKFRSTKSKIRTRASPTSNIAALNTSFSPADTLASLREHRWSYYDAQYLFLAFLGVFSLCVSETPGPLIKVAVASVIMLVLTIPVTRQFFLPFLPIAGWLIFFRACQFIPGTYRPGIWVRVLPALENIFYGANLSNVLAAHKSTVLDVLAWIPYGLTHFGAPVVCSALMFIFGPPGFVPVFARTFGYMNITGVIIQFMFPCSPPWYENLYGLAPANYSIQGSPAGLAAIDKLFGIDLYTSTFTASPVVFGAFPSLHAGCGTLEVLFMSVVFPKLRPLFLTYLLWLCWSTMYLSHHYAVDLVGGALLASMAFFIAKTSFLPRLQSDKFFRWDYDYVEVGEAQDTYAYGVADFNEDEFRHVSTFSESDAWSLGSSTSSFSFSSAHRHSASHGSLPEYYGAPQFAHRSSVDGSGQHSPVRVLIGSGTYNLQQTNSNDENEAMWEGDTLASASDNGDAREPQMTQSPLGPPSSGSHNTSTTNAISNMNANSPSGHRHHYSTGSIMIAKR